MSLCDEVLQETICPNCKSSSCIEKHGTCCAIHRVLSSSAPATLSPSNKKKLSSIITTLINDENALVRSASCVAIGLVIGSATTSDEVTSVEKSFFPK